MRCHYLGALVFLLLAGCASDVRTDPSPPPSSPPPAAPAASAPASQSAAESAFAEILKAAAAKPAVAPDGEGWQPMFDGSSLRGWRPTEFAGHGDVQLVSGLILLNMGDPFTGINWTNDFPKTNYEIALEAMRVMGTDFFCALTMPVGTNCCSLVVGGWGGSLVGISSLDSLDASENETTKYCEFERQRWYRIRVRVTEGRIEAWIDDDKLINCVTTGRRISVRPGEIELSQPLGICAWQTTSALREIRFRRVSAPAGPPPKGF